MVEEYKTVALDAELHKKLDIYCARKSMTIKEALGQAVEKYLGITE